MKLLSSLRSISSTLFRRSRTERDMDEELRSHIAHRAEDLMRSAGLSRAEAQRRARIEFGGYQKYKEEIRESLGAHFLETLLQDIRYALRMLRKSPGFTAIAVLTLALGIGANTAIFSAVDGILLEPLGYAGSSRLVEIESFQPGPSGLHEQGLSISTIRDLQAQCSAFEQLAAYQSYAGAKLSGGAAPDDVRSPHVTGDFFTMLGVAPLLGRPLLPSDADPGHNRVTVLNYAAWQSDFRGDPDVIGKTIELDKEPYAVVGVMPRDFSLGIDEYGLGVKRGVWLPLVPGPDFPEGRQWRMFFVVARLRKGFSLEQANVQLKTLSARLAAAYPKTEKGWEMSAASVKDEMVGRLQTGLMVLLTGVGFVLLIACTNISGLLLGRGWARQREVAIRNALGASRRRIIRQFLTESMLLAFGGGALGLLFSIWGIRILRFIAPANTPRLDDLRLNANVLWFTFAACIFSGIFFGLAPALRVSRTRRGAELKEGFRIALSGFSRLRRLRGALVILEVALALILLTGAGLVARSLRKLLNVNLGYRTDHVLTMDADLSGSACDYGHTEQCHLAFREMLRRIRLLPDVEYAALTSTTPFGGGYGRNKLQFEERPQENVTTGLHLYRMVTPAYFDVMGIPLLAGRQFTEHDAASSQRVTMVNHTFAEKYFRDTNPLGQHISMLDDKKGHPQWLQIVGEVADTRNYDLTEAAVPEFYIPVAQSDFLVTGAFVIRTAANPLALAGAVRQQIWAVDKDAPVLDLKTMDQIVAEQVAGPKFRAMLLEAFGVLGLLLAMVGVYGVISYSVTQRTHEIGVRMALGAQPRQVLRMVISEGMSLSFIGIVIGICGALALTRFLRTLLFEIKPTDPSTFAAVAILIAFVALTACYIPARRAMKVDPMVALRYE